MKTLFIVCTFLMGFSSCAQEKQQAFIEVTGSAEMTVIPDEIELEIILAHPGYLKSSGNSKNSIDELDKIFYDALETHKIPKTCLSFVAVDNPYYWYYWWWEYRHYTSTKTYKLKLDCKTYDFSFINEIKPEYIRSIRITKSTHSKITEYRRQVKKEAMIAAKEKASDLLECIGQKAGKVFEVIELQEPANANFWYNRYDMQNTTSNCIVSQPSSGSDSNENDAHVPSIKLRFEIKAKFEIL